MLVHGEDYGLVHSMVFSHQFSKTVNFFKKKVSSLNRQQLRRFSKFWIMLSMKQNLSNLKKKTKTPSLSTETGLQKY